MEIPNPMSRPRNAFRLLSFLLLSSLLPLAGCGGGSDQQAGDQAGNQQGDANTQRPAAPRGQNQGGKGRRGPKAHVALTGALTYEADVAMSCGTFPDKGLELSFDQTEARTPRVQVRVVDFVEDGEYPATVVITEHPESGPVREWNGAAKIKIQSHQAGKVRKRTSFNGEFDGTYEGQGGKGTLSGNFRRCVIRDLAP
jgi:hypothetical protein